MTHIIFAYIALTYLISPGIIADYWEDTTHTYNGIKFHTKEDHVAVLLLWIASPFLVSFRIGQFLQRNYTE